MSTRTTPKVKILYGVVSGERLGRRLRREIRNAGFSITKDRDEADIIMAHSAGCFWLHDVRPEQKLLLIDPPYWPGKTVRERVKVKADANIHFRRYGYGRRRWLAKNLWGVYYAVRDFNRTVRVAKHAGQYDLETIIGDRQATLVRNEHDAWLTPDLGELKRTHPQLRVVTLPGEHDDWFFNPKPYAELLKSLL